MTVVRNDHAYLCGLILLGGLYGVLSKDSGFLLTLPSVLRHGTVSEFCLTMFANDTRERQAALSFVDSESGQQAVKVEDFYPVGEQTCRKFTVPLPGEYEMLLTNSTDILHDSVKIIVQGNKLITLVQTDKPIYKPGQKVKFRILTLLSEMKPRTEQISSVYIKDPNDVKVKQYLNVDTQGIASLEFQLGKEAKLGQWVIEVNLEDETDETGALQTLGHFTVKEYVLPRFKVVIEPPPYILESDNTISGTVCGRYTYGKPVSGYLSLDLCWKERYGSSLPCHHQDVRLDGCYNFTVEAKDIAEGGSPFYYNTQELEIRAKITEDGTGVTVSQNHTGPEKSRSPLNIRLDDDTNSFFKPGLPYYGKVMVTLPDGTPAAEETITVTANDYHNPIRFSRTLTTDEAGRAEFAFCGGFTESTSSINLQAESPRLSQPQPQPDPLGPMAMISPVGMVHRASAHRQLRQWFSPSLSYIQLPRPDGPLTCRSTLILDVPFTTHAGAELHFQYQVMARGKVILTGQITVDTSRLQGEGVTSPPSELCLQREETSPCQGEEREDCSDTSTPGTNAFSRQADDIMGPPSDGFQEAIVRSAHVSDTASSFQFDLPMDPVMSPKFTLLVYHVTEEGEVVADSMQYDVEPCFENQVSLEFNETRALPGQNVDLTVGAAPGSVCGVGVVDKSVNILGGDHQITPAKVFEKIEEFTNSQYGPNTVLYGNNYEYCEERIKNLKGDKKPELEDSFWYYDSAYVDAIEAFKISGMLVLTDLDLETRPCGQTMPVFYAEVARTRNGPIYKGNTNGVVENQVSPSVRSNFPETWLWSLAVAGPEGEVVLTETAPDTITSWAANALCVDQDSGFGLSEVTSLTTFKPFFLSVHLPYAAVRGERLPIMLTVYNYLEKCITVKLDLDLGEEFEVHNSRMFRDPVCICGGKSYTAKYYVTPQDIGHLQVKAKSTVVAGQCKESVNIDLDYIGLSDEVHRKMLVKAEGVEQSYTHAAYLCSKDGTPLQQEVSLQLPAGKDVVKDSARGEVQVIGDIMGPALNNLDHLVRMPTGCGEQNMVGFVPNILVLNYLSSTGSLDDATRKSAIKNMEAGYQRELNYRHKDYSYSAFGESDPAGSVWLTAFVVKSFAQARQHIYIDEQDLNLSVNFLVRSQLENGCFRETGKVFSSYMMGGLSSGRRRRGEDVSLAALTAYVLVALMEAGLNKTYPAVEMGMDCVNRELRASNRRLDPYTMALITQANMKFDPTTRDAKLAFRTLRGKAKKDDTSMYWSRGRLQPPATNTWFYQAAPSAEVEMTSYALMSYLQYYNRKAVEMSHKIAMWLSRQRNAFGGFASTQDTVVGLDALSQFAALAYIREPTDLQVQVTSDGGVKAMDHVFTVTDGTRFLLQSEPIPALPTTLNISTSGLGCALVQTNVRYNKPPKRYLGGKSPKFNLKVSARPYQHDPDRCDRKTIYIRVGSRKGHKFSKGMGLVSVRMVTSWSPIPESITHLKSLFPVLGLKRIEYNEEEGLLSIYFDQFTRKAKLFALDVEQDQDLRVSNPKPAEIKVVEYYETDVTNVQPYSIKTICGTKAEIPRRRPSVPSDPFVAVRMDGPANIGFLQQTRVSTNQGCPVCLTNRKIPDNFRSAVCNASAVYKALSGRKGVRPLKLRQDLRPKKKLVNLGQFASYKMLPECNCYLLSTEGAAKRVIIVSSQKVSGKLLNLDRNSIIMFTSRKAENEARAAQATCPLEEDN